MMNPPYPKSSIRAKAEALWSRPRLRGIGASRPPIPDGSVTRDIRPKSARFTITRAVSLSLYVLVRTVRRFRYDNSGGQIVSDSSFISCNI